MGFSNPPVGPINFPRMQPAPSALSPGVPLRRRRLVRRVTIALCVVLLSLVAGAAIDAWAGRALTPRGLMIGDMSVGRLDRRSFASFLGTLQGRYDNTSITVKLSDRSAVLNGRDVGLEVDRSQLTQRAFSAGRTGNSVARVSSYLRSVTRGSTLSVPVDLDEDRLRLALRDLDAKFPDRPTDPTLLFVESQWIIEPGKPGQVSDTTNAAANITRRMQQDPGAVIVEVERILMPSNYRETELQSLITAASSATDAPLVVQAATSTVTVDPPRLRRSVDARVNGLKVAIRLTDGALNSVLTQLRSADRPPTDARFVADTVATDDPDSGPTFSVGIVPSTPGSRCCAEDSARRIEAALSTGQRKTVVLDSVAVQPEVTTEKLDKLKISEPVGTFTTKHAPGETRVKNIHRIADMLRGIVIEPGATFSVNDTIGPRSKDNGFFSAGVIDQGIFKEDFGGGISQFATTMFNAAFFAGLDLVEYQSHSLYIPRYPYGREATLSFPSPDLKIANNTPYGVMIWPTYTDRSITVTLLSTRYVTGTVVGQRKIANRSCTAVYTERQRTYVDGRSERDTVEALYRPGEGRDCDGNLTPAAQALEQERAARAKAREAARAKKQAQARAAEATPKPPVASEPSSNETSG